MCAAKIYIQIYSYWKNYLYPWEYTVVAELSCFPCLSLYRSIIGIKSNSTSSVRSTLGVLEKSSVVNRYRLASRCRRNSCYRQREQLGQNFCVRRRLTTKLLAASTSFAWGRGVIALAWKNVARPSDIFRTIGPPRPLPYPGQLSSHTQKFLPNCSFTPSTEKAPYWILRTNQQHI